MWCRPRPACRCGSCCRRTRPLRWGRSRGVGGSSPPWGGGCGGTRGARRVFLLIGGFGCAPVVPATPPEFRWVAWLAAGLATFWGVALGAEDIAKGGRRGGGKSVPPVGGTPFDPPAPPET